jgi:dipeptidase
MGNCNEFGLCLAESSWESIDLLKKGKQENALIDYGSLMFITLQRCKSASEAIDTMASLMDTYGYASLGGETFSIVDGKEAWIMDVVGRGAQKVGAVWVAQRVPDGSVVAMANRVKTKVFPKNDPENCRYSADVVNFARELGLYQGEDDESFNFQATYSIASPASTHFSQSRVLDIYSHLLPNREDFYNTYINYVMSGGVGLNDTNDDLPLWIQPQQKLTLNDVRDRLSSHFEGTSLEYGPDLASGLFSSPYRPKPLTWEYQKKTYLNERPVANEFTGTSFISVIRGWMPLPLQAIVWVGMDDSSTCPRYPVYASSVAGSQYYIGKGSQDGVPTTQIMKFHPQKAFWIQNLVRT